MQLQPAELALQISLVKQQEASYDHASFLTQQEITYNWCMDPSLAPFDFQLEQDKYL